MVDFRHSLIDLKDDDEFFICGCDKENGLMFLDKKMQWHYLQRDHINPLEIIKEPDMIWKLSDVAKKSDFDLQIAQRYSISPIGYMLRDDCEKTIIITTFAMLFNDNEEEK